MSIHPKLQPVTDYLRVQQARLTSKMQSKQFWQVTHLLIALFAVLSLLVGYFAYQIGKRHGQQVSAVIAIDYKGEAITAQEVQSMRLENDILKTEIATLIQERDISLNNLNLIKDEMHRLKSDYEETKQLNEAMSTTRTSVLEIVDMQMKAIDSDVFEYRFDVLATQSQKFRPKLTLLNATSMVEVPFDKSSYEVKGLATIKGQFIMPSGFTPSQLKLELEHDGKPVVKLYNWQPQ